MPRREDHEAHKDMWGIAGEKKKRPIYIFIISRSVLLSMKKFERKVV